MADRSAIQWTDATWNPTTGCDQISPGCANCYAKTWAARGLGNFAGGRPFEDVRVHEDRLEAPLRWKKPRRIFVDSMSDLFHEAVPDAFIDRVFAVMALAPQHTFQILTKRAERMRAYMETFASGHRQTAKSAREMFDPHGLGLTVAFEKRDAVLQAQRNGGGPLPNVWLGVSVENQHFADERIPLLLETPAAIRFISAEPLLGPIDMHGPLDKYGTRPKLNYWLPPGRPHFPPGEPGSAMSGPLTTAHALDWVIVGGESGTGARPFDVAWARSIIAQCQAAGVPVFVKQLGVWPLTERFPTDIMRNGIPLHDGPAMAGNRILLHDRKGGDMAEWPEDLRVREFPA